MSLRVEGLHFTYDGAPLLQGINLEVAAGESGFLLGPSGVGKSTVLRCIAGLERPEAGTVMLGNEPLDALAPASRRVGLLFQEPALFPHLDVWHNVAFGLRYRDVPRHDRREEAERWLDMVGLAGRETDRVDELSGGQRQRVALARTLAAKPRAVLLDEPFSALDRSLRDDLGSRMQDLVRSQNIPALWVTHDEDEAHRLGDRVWRLVDGAARPEKP